MSKRNAIKLLQVVPSLGNLLKPVQYAIRRFSDVIKDREKAEESIYVRKREDSELRIRRKELESEVKAIYSGIYFILCHFIVIQLFVVVIQYG